MTRSTLPRRTAAAASVALIAAASAPVMADPGDGRFDHHGMMGWGGWFFGPLMMVLIVALLVGAVLAIVRLIGSGPGQSSGTPPDRSQAIPRERFARGEITREEFEAAKKVLG